MDQISRIRFKNVADRLLDYCDDAEGDKEHAILLRISLVALNKLRVHADIDSMLGYDVRELTQRVERCTDQRDLLELWEETTDLVGSYKEALAT